MSFDLKGETDDFTFTFKGQVISYILYRPRRLFFLETINQLFIPVKVIY